MKIYDCKVRLAGNVLNEVRKPSVTAAEIMMLQLIHGGTDAVLDIRETGEARRSNDDERARLRHAYRDVIMKTERGQMDPIMQLFGPDHLPLPSAVKAPAPAVAPAAEIADLIG